ncbi:MAG TPA: helix-turn-helix transcriptional regulator [Niabella sp.]|nr:helix-turn-helix transcriptional regulator [Niabella sp.]
MQLGLFLKRYRKRVHLSGEQLAHKVGISRYALEKYENAGIMPGYEAASKLQRFFGITNLKDIKESELEFCIEHSFTIPGKHPMVMQGGDPGVNTQKDTSYTSLILEKDKKIADLEEQVALLKEQLHTLKNGGR